MENLQPTLTLPQSPQSDLIAWLAYTRVTPTSWTGDITPRMLERARLREYSWTNGPFMDGILYRFDILEAPLFIKVSSVEMGNITETDRSATITIRIHRDFMIYENRPISEHLETELMHVIAQHSIDVAATRIKQKHDNQRLN